MPVNLSAPLASDLHPIAGIRIGTAEAGIKKLGRKDLTVFLLDEGAAVACVFTQNRFCAAPVQVAREHLAAGSVIRALVINTGNANAGTGADGLVRARRTCATAAQQLGVDAAQVLPYSTGVIMEPLPVERIEAGLPRAIADAAPAQWGNAALAIMTTDTVPKAFSTQLDIGGVRVSITGISKGAGMIRPNMATMLGFLATDACVAPALLPGLVRELAEQSFNRITIDGDTSTNDSFTLIARHWWRLSPGWRAGWRRPSYVTERVPPSSSRCRWKVVPMVRNAARWLTPLRIRHWSKRRSSPATPTSVAFWRRWAMRVLPIWTRR